MATKPPYTNQAEVLSIVQSAISEERVVITDEIQQTVQVGALNAAPGDSPAANVTVYNAIAAGAYTNFSGIVVSSNDMAAGLVQLRLNNGTWYKAIISVALDNYVELEDFKAFTMPEWIKNKTTDYTDNELKIIYAIKKLVVLPQGGADDNFIVQYVSTDPTIQPDNMAYMVQVQNLTSNKYYQLFLGGISYVVPDGLTIVESRAFDTANTGTYIDFYLVIDFKALPAQFESEPVLSQLSIATGVNTAEYGIIQQVHDIEAQLPGSDYLLDKALPLAADEQKIISAVSTLDLKVLQTERGQDWRITMVNTYPSNSGLIPAYLYTIGIRNYTTNDYYYIVKDTSLDITALNGISVYYGTAFSDNTPSKSVKFNVVINWSKLPNPFTYLNNFTGNIKLIPNYKKEESVIIEALGNESSYWSGKRILGLGTSKLIGGYQGTEETSYFNLACRELGAIPINNGRGSSMARRAGHLGTYSGLPWTLVSNALSQTYDEKEFIIANFSTLGTLDTPTSLSDADKTYIRQGSYMYKLLPYLNGTIPAPDAIVIEHGYNGMNFFTVNPSDPNYDQPAWWTGLPPTTRNDRNYEIGALIFLLDLIFQYKPRMRVFIIGNDENQRFPRVAQMQTFLSNYFELPICKMWEKTQWSQQIAVGSKTLWSTQPYQTYAANADTTQDLTLERIAKPDDVHGFSDTSGKSVEIQKNYLKSFLKQTY